MISAIFILFLMIISEINTTIEKDYIVNIENKLSDCQKLVSEAMTFFSKKPIAESCDYFSRDLKWRRGEIAIFVFREDGICFVFGDDKSVIWQNFKKKKNFMGNEFISEMLAEGKKGGMVSFRWNSSRMEAYVKTVIKNKMTYIIGAGFYPTSAEYVAKQLVIQAVAYGQTNGPKRLMEEVNNSRGMFIQGDVYLYVYNNKGEVTAHGESFELIGQDMLDQMTIDGKYRTRDILEIVRKEPGEGWYTYLSRQGGAEKRSYVARYFDQKSGELYAIVGGYYPKINESTVKSTVKKAAHYLRSYGQERALPEFSKKNSEFAFGSITIFVYGVDGVMLADMANPAFIGLNLMNARDSEGKYITRTILEHAEKYPQGGWVSFALKNSYAMFYLEKINTPDGDFIMGASYYPIEKYIRVRFMVDRAAVYLKNNPTEEALDFMSSGDSDFLRGDLSIFVLNKEGISLIDGNNKRKIWRSNKHDKDDQGKPITKKLLSIASSGGGWFEYPYANAIKKMYVKQVEKTNTENEVVEDYVIGCGYYL